MTNPTTVTAVTIAPTFAPHANIEKQCDDLPKVVILACGLLGGATDTYCQKALLSDIHRALGGRLEGTGGGERGAFYRRQQARVAFVLEAMEATEAFNRVADAEVGQEADVVDMPRVESVHGEHLHTIDRRSSRPSCP